MKIELKDATKEQPPAEKLVMLFYQEGAEGEPGVWDAELQTFVDINGFELPSPVTHWAYFPVYQKPKPRRLLIVSCSATKAHDPGRLSALMRYTGAYYSIIKGHRGELPEIVILSAEHGFISSSEGIKDYDRRMDAARAAELLPGASIKLGALLGHHYDDVFIAAGEEYRKVITPALAGVMGTTFKQIRYARGGIGYQRQQLKAWLSGLLKEADNGAPVHSNDIQSDLFTTRCPSSGS